jgi:hypothetical protein
VFLGLPLDTEAFDTDADVIADLTARVAAGELDPSVLSEDGERAIHRRYRVGNLDLGQQSFRWVPLHEIETTAIPKMLRCWNASGGACFWVSLMPLWWMCRLLATVKETLKAMSKRLAMPRSLNQRHD